MVGMMFEPKKLVCFTFTGSAIENILAGFQQRWERCQELEVAT